MDAKEEASVRSACRLRVWVTISLNVGPTFNIKGAGAVLTERGGAFAEFSVECSVC